MTTNVEVKKTSSENSLSLLRRFTKRVQESGVLPRVRSIRYNDRPESRLKRKRSALRVLAKRKVYEKLKKLGRAPVGKKGRRR